MHQFMFFILVAIQLYLFPKGRKFVRTTTRTTMLRRSLQTWLACFEKLDKKVESFYVIRTEKKLVNCCLLSYIFEFTHMIKKSGHSEPPGSEADDQAAVGDSAGFGGAGCRPRHDNLAARQHVRHHAVRHAPCAAATCH